MSLAITQVPSPFFMERNGQVPRFVIIHGTAGGSSAAGVAQWFQNSRSKVSTHYVVDKQGEIVQCVDEKFAAWGNGVITVGADRWWAETGNPNFCSISIENVKAATDNSDQITQAQQAALFPLVLDICQRWRIPLRKADRAGGIIGHCSIDPINRSECPGPFPWDELFDYLAGGSDTVIDIHTPKVSEFFIEKSPTHWYCAKTGFSIKDGMLDFYKKIGKDGLCGLTYLGLPLSKEIVLSKEPYATVQVFERGLSIYDPQRIVDHPPGREKELCYLGHIDRIETNPLLAAKQQEIQALQQTKKK